VSRRQIWQAFVQESIRAIASLSNIDITLRDNLSIDEVAKEAFHILGENGIIRAADGHACQECTQKYRGSDTQSNSDSSEDDVDSIQTPVKMVVVDGIVMGHSICAYPECESELINARGGIYCALHEDLYGAKCHVANCTNDKQGQTLACEAHQAKWRRFQKYHQARQMSGYRRALRQADDTLPWMQQRSSNQQPHDQEANDSQSNKDHFIPSRTYCVETLCAPCGVVVAWTNLQRQSHPLTY
jgi:hypothetical protein